MPYLMDNKYGTTWAFHKDERGIWNKISSFEKKLPWETWLDGNDMCWSKNGKYPFATAKWVFKISLFVVYLEALKINMGEKKLSFMF